MGLLFIKKLMFIIGDCYDILADNTQDVNVKRIEGIPAEIDVVSTRTGRCVGFWAYGYYEPDFLTSNLLEFMTRHNTWRAIIVTTKHFISCVKTISKGNTL